MVCLVEAAETVAAWIHLPMQTKTLVAERGSGAWVSGERLAVTTAGDSYRGSISTKFFPPPRRERIDAARAKFATHESARCAATTYAQLVTGELDIAMYFRLMPWDHAPGVLIHAEAGGYSARLNGEPYSPLVHSEGLLVAPSREDWVRVMEMVGER
jgi:fructose-1,6-bisphosphatase/inositol monophosphatase family enzyme